MRLNNSWLSISISILGSLSCRTIWSLVKSAQASGLKWWAFSNKFQEPSDPGTISVSNNASSRYVIILRWSIRVQFVPSLLRSNPGHTITRLQRRWDVWLAVSKFCCLWYDWNFKGMCWLCVFENFLVSFQPDASGSIYEKHLQGNIKNGWIRVC